MMGNGISTRPMFGWFSVSLRIDFALDGVVMMVTLILRWERALERSSNGRVWP